MAGSLVLNFWPCDGPLDDYERCEGLKIDDADDDVDVKINFKNVESYKKLFVPRLDDVLERDNQDDFVELINRTPCDFEEDYLEHETIEAMMQLDAVECADALLCRPTKICNPAFLMSKCFTTPLHHAASEYAYKILARLLERGFSADDRCDWSIGEVHDTYYKCHRGNPRLLPLGAALLSFRKVVCLSNGPISAKRYIVHVFHKIKSDLETIRLLAENSREVKQEFYNYLMEGKMIEVGALLLVARSRILSPSSSTIEGEFQFQSISEMYDCLLDAKRDFSISAGATHLEQIKLFEMEQTLLLLQIFDRIGDKLITLSRLDFNPTPGYFFPNLAAASLLEDAGFDVMSKEVRYDEIVPTTRRKYPRRGDIKKCTTFALPYWLKEAPSRSSVLADKSPALREGNRVSVSALASASSAPEITSLHHLLKSTAPLAGSFKRFFRR